MSTVTRGTKAAGGTSFVDDTDILASEVNTDLDTLYTLVNGGLDSDNISASASIPNSALVDIDGTKVSDHADSNAVYAQTTSPGDSAVPDLPENLEETEERLRYRINRLTRYANNDRYMSTADAIAAASWTEPPIQGTNLLVNSGFEGPDPNDNAPYGWTEEGTLTTSSNVAAPDINGSDKRAFSMQGGANTGISQTLYGLKDSTKYLFGVTYVRAAGTFKAVVESSSGGLGSGNAYQDPTYTENTSSGTETVNLIFKTGAAAEDVKFSILSGASSGDIDVIEAWVYELNDNKPAETPTGLMQTASASTEVTNIPATVASATDWDTQWTDVSTLALSQFVPSHGYRLVYEASIAWASVLNSQQYFFGFRLELDTGSTSVVDGPYIEMDDDVSLGETNGAGVVRLTYVIDNPTPGTTYTLTPQVTAADSAGGAGSAPRLHPLVAVTAQGGASAGSNSAIQTTSRAWLRLERI